MSRRRRQGLSPSLFPFLAVLVCTLGTLILFLALVAQNATEAAEQNAQAERVAKLRAAKKAAEPVAPRLTAKSVQSMLDEEQFRVEQLVAFRDKQTSDLGDRRDQITYLEEQMQRLRQQLQQLSDEVDHAMGESNVGEIEDGEIADLRRRIDAERAAVEKLRSESENKTPRVVIVPHKGPNGTDRRPVYLECNAQGVTIWPEGSQITITQLEDANYSANPLDAALRVVRLHAMQNYGDTAPPYPLLVVRPDGIDSYAAARGAMQDWDDQFGYELVPAEVQLAYSKPDSNLKQRVDVAIRDAAAKQHAQYAISLRARGGGGSPARGTDLHGTGHAGTGRGRRLPTLSAASLDRAGRAGGFRSLRDSSQPRQSPYAASSAYSSGSPYGSSNGTGSRSGNFNGESTYQQDQAAADARRWADEMRTAAREMRDSETAGESERGARGGTENGSSENPTSRQPGDVAAGETSGDPEPNAARYGQPPRTNRHVSDGRGEALNPSESLSASSGDSKTGDSQTGDSRVGGTATESQSASQQQAAGGNGGRASSSTMMSPQAGSNGASQQSTSGGPPKMSINASPQQELVRRQGRDWALPPEMAGIHGNAIVRTIRVQCYQDRFVLLPPASGGATEMFGFSSGDVDQATLRLATAVRDRIERWGPALTGGRWQPRLDVIVMPKGETRFHQLRTLMSGSGIEVSGRASP